MCGRYTEVSSTQLLVSRFSAEPHDVADLFPSYNVAPRATVPVVRLRVRDDIPSRVLTTMRWGLVPSWATDPKIGDRMINARAETLTTKPAYRQAFAKRRCLIPADGFYEWQAQTGRVKQPMFIHARDGEPLAF